MNTSYPAVAAFTAALALAVGCTPPPADPGDAAPVPLTKTQAEVVPDGEAQTNYDAFTLGVLDLGDDVWPVGLAVQGPDLFVADLQGTTVLRVDKASGGS